MKSNDKLIQSSYPFFFISFFLLVIAVNPFYLLDNALHPFDDNEVYWRFVLPKIFVLLVISLYSAFLCFRFRLFDLGNSNSLTRRFYTLVFGFIASLVVTQSVAFDSLNYSRFTYSFLGHPEMGDGFFYWSLLLFFVCFNFLLVSTCSKIFYAQLYGFLWGLVPLGLSSLVSFEYFYTHRGHVSFVFLVAAALVKERRNLFAAPIMLSSIHASIAAFGSLLMAKFLKNSKSYYFFVVVAIASFVVLDAFDFAYATLFERFKYWSYAIHAMKPDYLLFGYGFNGFDLAVNYHPAKAHNIFIDAFVSWGVSGLVFYCLILLYLASEFLKANSSTGIALISVYLIFGFFWYDCAQYSHFIWWGLSSSLALISPFKMEKIYE